MGFVRGGAWCWWWMLNLGENTLADGGGTLVDTGYTLTKELTDWLWDRDARRCCGVFSNHVWWVGVGKDNSLKPCWKPTWTAWAKWSECQLWIWIGERTAPSFHNGMWQNVALRMKHSGRFHWSKHPSNSVTTTTADSCGSPWLATCSDGAHTQSNTPPSGAGSLLNRFLQETPGSTERESPVWHAWFKLVIIIKKVDQVLKKWLVDACCRTEWHVSNGRSTIHPCHTCVTGHPLPPKVLSTSAQVCIPCCCGSFLPRRQASTGTTNLTTRPTQLIKHHLDFNKEYLPHN